MSATIKKGLNLSSVSKSKTLGYITEKILGSDIKWESRDPNDIWQLGSDKFLAMEWDDTDLATYFKGLLKVWYNLEPGGRVYFTFGVWKDFINHCDNDFKDLTENTICKIVETLVNGIPGQKWVVQQVNLLGGNITDHRVSGFVLIKDPNFIFNPTPALSKKLYLALHAREPDMIALRKEQNAVKLSLLKTLVGPLPRLVDIGSGRGGDLHKWKQIGAQVLAVEPNSEHIAECKSRLVKNGYRLTKDNRYVFAGGSGSDGASVRIIQAYGQDTEIIKPNVEPLSNVCLFNSLTFLFESPETLAGLLNTINIALAPGKKLIGTVMDGQKVAAAFASTGGKLSGAGWQMERVYKNDGVVFGQKIKIHLDDTIVTNQEEYLFNWETFVEELARIGIVLEYTYFLPGTFNEFYRAFSFIRRENEPVRGTEPPQAVPVPKEKSPTPQVSPAQPQQPAVPDVEEEILFTELEGPITFLKPEERQDFIFKDVAFVRIGNVDPMSIVGSIMRAIFVKYIGESNKSTDEHKSIKLRKSQIENVTNKIIDQATESVPEEILKTVSPNEWQLYFEEGVLEELATAFKCGIIIINFESPFESPNIIKAGFSNGKPQFDRTCVLYHHDSVFDTVGQMDATGTLITSFSKMDLTINTL